MILFKLKIIKLFKIQFLIFRKQFKNSNQKMYGLYGCGLGLAYAAPAYAAYGCGARYLW